MTDYLPFTRPGTAARFCAPVPLIVLPTLAVTSPGARAPGLPLPATLGNALLDREVLPKGALSFAAPAFTAGRGPVLMAGTCVWGRTRRTGGTTASGAAEEVSGSAARAPSNVGEACARSARTAAAAKRTDAQRVEQADMSAPMDERHCGSVPLRNAAKQLAAMHRCLLLHAREVIDKRRTGRAHSSATIFLLGSAYRAAAAERKARMEQTGVGLRRALHGWAMATLICGLGVVSSERGVAAEPTANDEQICLDEEVQAPLRIPACSRVAQDAGRPNGVRASALVARAQLAAAAGDHARAVNDYTAAIGLDAKDPSAWMGRGSAQEALGQLEKALADYDEAIRLNPKDASGYYNRAGAYDQKGDSERALADYDMALNLDSNFASAYNNRGLVYYNLGNYDKAVEDYTAALAVTPDDADVYYNRGAAYEQMGEDEKAAADYRKALELNPGHQEAKASLQDLEE